MRALLHLRLAPCRLYSTAPPLINIRSIPASHTGRITILTLNRPSAKNAISRALLSELRTHIAAVHAEQNGETRALVIGSAIDGVFCAGADLKERAGFTPEDTAQFLAALRGTLRELAALPIPTIAAISSVALGGGLELALATTFRIVAPDVQLALPETRLGILPGAGGTYRLPQLIGRSRAMDMILTARRVGGIEAAEIGLANWVVEVGDGEEEGGGGGGGGGGGEKVSKDEGREKVIDAAVEIAQEMCLGGPIALRAAMRAVDGQCEAAENAAYETVVGTKDRNEALAAFREKRRPVFKGE